MGKYYYRRQPFLVAIVRLLQTQVHLQFSSIAGGKGTLVVLLVVEQMQFELYWL